MAQEISGVISNFKPRRGRGPAIVGVLMPDGSMLDVSTFDPQHIQIASTCVGAPTIVWYEEKESKDGTRIYKNMVAISAEMPPERPQEAQEEASVPETVPTQPVQGSLPVRMPPRPVGSNPYLLFDHADDEAIIAKLKGAVVSAYVYKFEQQGKPVYGLGVDGAEACKRELARNGEIIEEESITLEKDDNSAGYFTAKASRWAVSAQGNRIKLDTAIGTKRQPKLMPGGSPNPFWYEQGCSKAMRNALLRLTPEGIKQRVIEMYKQEATKVEEE